MSEENSSIIAAKKSKGTSSFEIYNPIIEIVNNLIINQNINKILDIGCGHGLLLKELKLIHPNLELNGADIYNFSELNQHNINYYQLDLNRSFDNLNDSYDLIISSEVIEHLENPHNFIQTICKLLVKNKKGYIILTTPNIESITSIISFILRGYHSAFGPSDYPAHISPLSLFELQNIIKRANLFVKNVQYIPNGRIPGTNLRWHKLLPFLKGKRFSDNYLILIENKS